MFCGLFIVCSANKTTNEEKSTVFPIVGLHLIKGILSASFKFAFQCKIVPKAEITYVETRKSI